MPTAHKTKQCRHCRIIKAIDEYAFTGSHNRRSICKSCINLKQAENKKKRHKLRPAPRHAPASDSTMAKVLNKWLTGGIPVLGDDHGS